MRGRAACLALLLCLNVGALRAEGSGCQASARASKAEVTAGEVFIVEVSAAGPPGAQFSFPREAASDHVELWATDGPPAPGRALYQALALAVGETQIPPLEVTCSLADGSQLKVETVPIPLRMVSVLPKDPKEQTLRDVRPPLALSVGRPFWIALGLLLCCAGLAAVWLFRMRRRGQAVRPTIAISPSEEARAALAGLVSAGLLARRDFRDFYIRLIAIAKRYLGRRLEAPVPDMTSSETVAFLRQHPRAEAVAATARELLLAGDQVKFAQGDGMSAEAERHVRAVSGMIAALETTPAREAER